jgi:hypothetical protein
MYRYLILVSKDFAEKFESFLDNLNLVNSKNVVTTIKKEEVVAEPKKG